MTELFIVPGKFLKPSAVSRSGEGSVDVGHRRLVTRTGGSAGPDVQSRSVCGPWLRGVKSAHRLLEVAR